MSPVGRSLVLSAGALSLVVHSARAATVVHTGTAAADVVVVVVEALESEPAPSQDPAAWRVDGSAVPEVGRWSYPWHEEPAAQAYLITMRHHMYLRLPAPVAEGRSYDLTTPYGDLSFTFRERDTPSSPT